MGKLRLEEALRAATSAALTAGGLLRQEFHREGGPRHQGKHHADVDREAEEGIRKSLLEAFPDFDYVGEETGRHGRGTGAPTWYVDPNDGTRAFIEGYRGSAVSIALVVDGRPVLGVVYAATAPDDGGDLIAWAEGLTLTRNGQPVERAALTSSLQRDDVVLVSQGADRHVTANLEACAPARFRSMPSIAYRLALVAVGEGEAGVSLNGPVAWDFAAGHALLRAVGGELVDETGNPIRYGPGGASGRWVFGGHPEVAKALARRPWDTVRERRDKAPKLVGGLDAFLPSHASRVDDSGLLARAQGSLLGQLAGDALGALVEFRSAADIRAEYPDGVRRMVDGGTHGTIAGQPTDDSELALILARRIACDGTWEEKSVREGYQAWLGSAPFDVGGTTLAGLSGRPNLASEANGSLMRISPLAIWAHGLVPDEVARYARADSALTHPNAVCGDAVAAYAVAIAHAIRTGEGARQTYEAALRWAQERRLEASVLRTLEHARSQPPGDFLRHQGWVLVALQNAFFQLLHAPSLEAGLVDTVGRGGDTDTNGAIAGALLGAVFGRDAVPQAWRRAVLTCRSVDGRHPRPRTFWPVDALDLAEALVGTTAPSRFVRSPRP